MALDEMDDLARFATRCLAVAPSEFVWALREGLAYAAARNGGVADIALACNGLPSAPLEAGLALTWYEAYRLGTSGDEAAAADLALRAAVVTDTAGSERLGPSRNIGLKVALGRMLVAYGSHGPAVSILTSALADTVARRDERATIAVLGLLADAREAPELREEARRARDALIAASDYAASPGADRASGPVPEEYERLEVSVRATIGRDA